MFHSVSETVFVHGDRMGVLPITMPEFVHPFSGNAAITKLSHSELVRAVRFMIAAEYEAIQLYEQLAESTDNDAARRVLRDIADEEKEHVGEFQQLLSLLAPQDEDFYREGREEAAIYLDAMQAREGACVDKKEG